MKISIKKNIVALAALLTFGQLFGQQLPLYTQYYINPFIYNPSLAGTGKDVNAFLIHHSQWNDMPGAPVTSIFSIDGPIKEKNIGLGVSVYNDVSDIISRTGFNSSYSYRLPINTDEQNLYFGLGLGVSDNRIDFSKAVIKDGSDPVVMTQNQRKTNIDASFGVSYTWKSLVAGISVPQMLANSVEFKNNDTRTFYNLSRHYLVSAKYTFNVVESKGITAYPLVMARVASGIPLQYDINAVTEWANRGWFAVSYKSDYAVGFNVGVNIGKSLRAGYAYDFINGPLKAYSGTSHEILLGFTFGRSEAEASGSNEKIQMLENRVLENEQQIKNNKEEIEKVKNDVQSIGSANDSLKNNSAEANKKRGDKKGFVTTGLTEDYNNLNGTKVLPGHYLIIGSFKNREFAERAQKKYAERGFAETTIIVNNKTQVHYVYIKSAVTPETLMDDLTKVRAGEAPDSWIFHLED